MVPKSLQVREVIPPLVPAKGKRILPFRLQSQSGMTLEGVGSQVYSGPIIRSRAKASTYAELTLQSSVTTVSQGMDQPKERDEVTSPTFYDLRTPFHKE